MPEFWPFIPNSLNETLQFATDIRSAPSGEVRDSLKAATQMLNLGYTMADSDAAKVDGLYRSDPLGEFTMPDWPQATHVPGTVSGTVVNVDDETAYEVGGTVCVMLSPDHYELGTIGTTSAGQITLDQALSGSFVGSEKSPVLVAPVRRYIAPRGISNQVQYGTTLKNIRFLCLEPNGTGLSPFPSHRGFDVITDPSIVSSPLEGSVTQAMEVIDSGFGVYAVEDVEDYVRDRSMLSFFDVENRAERRSWLHHVRGRDAAFWVPSWKRDLVPAVTLGAFGTTLLIEHITPDPSDLVGVSVQFDGMFGVIHREITAAVGTSGTHALTIEAPGVSIPAGARVSIMRLMRFDTDNFEIEHKYSADGLMSKFSAPVVEVPE